MVALVPGLRSPESRRPVPAGPISATQVIRLFLALKTRLIVNGLTRSNARLIVGLIGIAAAIGMTIAGSYLAARLRGADAADAYLLLVIGGSVLVFGWFLLPLLIFGIDESIDPRRFTLLPIPRRALLGGMLAAGFAGLPAAATLIVSMTTVATWSRGVLPALFAAVGAVLATAMCVVASRTVTTALSEMFRSRRVRDLWSVAGMLLIGAVALLQIGLPSVAQLATRDTIERITAVLAWTPLGAAWAAPHDALTGSATTGVARLLVVAVSLTVLLAIWDLALRRSLEHSGSSGRVRGRSRPERGSRRGLSPGWARWALPPTVTGAVAARILVLWWRDPRQRVSLLIVPLMVLAVVIGPTMAGFTDPILVLVAPGIGTLIGLMMLNHTAYDGTAIWTHLAVSLPGRIDRAGRALGTAVWALPVVTAAAATVCVTIGRPDLLPAAVGSSVATVLIGLAFASVSSVVIAFPAPPASANPFITPSGGNVVVVLQQFAGGLAAGMLSLPVYLVLALATWWRPEIGWMLLAAGPLYGLLLLRIGNRVGGRYLDEHGPELLRRITPSRT